MPKWKIYVEKMEISSANVKYSEEYIDTVYDYQTTLVEKSNGKLLVSLVIVEDYFYLWSLFRNSTTIQISRSFQIQLDRFHCGKINKIQLYFKRVFLESESVSLENSSHCIYATVPNLNNLELHSLQPYKGSLSRYEWSMISISTEINFEKKFFSVSILFPCLNWVHLGLWAVWEQSQSKQFWEIIICSLLTFCLNKLNLSEGGWFSFWWLRKKSIS